MPNDRQLIALYRTAVRRLIYAVATLSVAGISQAFDAPAPVRALVSAIASILTVIAGLRAFAAIRNDRDNT